MITRKQAEAIQARCDAATPGPWEVWDGPAYEGGGRDLCIATVADEKWLANMDHRVCRNFGDHMSEMVNRASDPSSCAAEERLQVCSLDTEPFTEEQVANAVHIAAARADLPAVTAALVEAMEAMRRNCAYHARIIANGPDCDCDYGAHLCGWPEYVRQTNDLSAMLAAWDKEEGDE